MKRIIIPILAMVTAIAIGIVFVHHRVTQKTFALEWHEITLQTYDTMKPTFELLQAIFVEAFLPVIKSDVYKYDPRVANIPLEQRPLIEEKVNALITETSQAKWNRKISKLHSDLQNKRIPIAYVVIARDNHNEARGFALFIEERMKDDLDARLLNIIEGSGSNVESTSLHNDEVHVSVLAVKPATQQRGVGKALIFSVFDHCPHIKRIYLTTSASDSNKKTQGFYEHLGFVPVLKGVFLESVGESDFDKEKIMYLYQK